MKKDFIFSSYWFCKFINKFIKGGNGIKLLKHLLNLFKIFKLVSLDFLLLLKESLEVLKQPLALKKISLKKEIPFYISEYYQYKRSLCWIVKSIKRTNLSKTLVDELILIATLNSGSKSLILKKEYENRLYNNRFFKNYKRRV